MSDTDRAHDGGMSRLALLAFHGRGEAESAYALRVEQTENVTS